MLKFPLGGILYLTETQELLWGLQNDTINISVIHKWVMFKFWVNYLFNAPEAVKYPRLHASKLELKDLCRGKHLQDTSTSPAVYLSALKCQILQTAPLTKQRFLKNEN